MIRKIIYNKKANFLNNNILKRYKRNVNYVFNWMRKLKLKNPTILDVGACIGSYKDIGSGHVVYIGRDGLRNV